MDRLLSEVLPSQTRRARGDLAAAWEHLLSAAGHGASQVGAASRRQSAVARERAALARLALRGELPAAPWRWVGGALATGVVLGAAGAVATGMLARRWRASRGQPSQTEPEQAGAATSALRDRASAAAHGVATTARETATRARDTATKVGEKVSSRVARSGPAGEQQPGEPAPVPAEDTR